MSKQILEWSDSYLVGIEELDIEHKELINRLNQLHKKFYRRHSDRSSFESYLKDIQDRIHTHFIMEEAMMRDSAYPDFVQHKKEHDAFLQVIDNLVRKYRTNPGYSFENVVEDILRQWIGNHIAASDHKLGIHLIRDQRDKGH